MHFLFSLVLTVGCQISSLFRQWNGICISNFVSKVFDAFAVTYDKLLPISKMELQ